MKIEDLRGKINETDNKIVRLITERMKIAEEIGREKRKQGKQIEDEEREKKVLEKVRGIAREEGINEEAIESIYKQIITISKRVQGMAVAFQG